MTTNDLHTSQLLASDRRPNDDDRPADKDAVARTAPPSTDEDYRVAASLAHRNPA